MPGHEETTATREAVRRDGDQDVKDGGMSYLRFGACSLAERNGS